MAVRRPRALLWVVWVFASVNAAVGLSLIPAVSDMRARLLVALGAVVAICAAAIAGNEASEP